MPTTSFYLNGAAVLAEYPDRLAEPPRRAAWGTVIRQPEGTLNWFHFAPTTPVNGFTTRGSFQLWLDWVSLRANLDGAQIEDVHVRAGERLLYNLNDPARLPIASRTVNERFPSDRLGFTDLFHDRGGLTVGYDGFALAVLVRFTEDVGRVIFRSAGFGYYQWGG